LKMIAEQANGTSVQEDRKDQEEIVADAVGQ